MVVFMCPSFFNAIYYEFAIDGFAVSVLLNVYIHSFIHSGHNFIFFCFANVSHLNHPFFRSQSSSFRHGILKIEFRWKFKMLKIKIIMMKWKDWNLVVSVHQIAKHPTHTDVIVTESSSIVWKVSFSYFQFDPIRGIR